MTITLENTRVNLSNLEELTVKELSVIALENNISLSYKSKSGTRKRRTKQELVKMIVAYYDKSIESDTSNTGIVDGIGNEIKLGDIISLVDTKENFELLPINKIVVRARKALVDNDISTIENLSGVVDMKIKAEKVNSLEVAKMSNVLNILKGMIKIHSKVKKKK